MSITRTSKKNVISASRRTDIPAFYMDWFMDQIKLGRFEVINPYSKKISYVPVSPTKTHTIVFWSKNFSPFIQGEYGIKLKSLGYNLFFNFTLNTPDTILEPNIPHLDKRLEQMHHLCRYFGAGSINWRFDPICHYTYNSSDIKNNLKAFNYIAEKVGNWGIKRCITSFMDDYAKIRKRTKSIKGFSFISPVQNKKIEIINTMETILKAFGIKLLLCCEKTLAHSLPADTSVSASSCVPNTLFEDLYGGRLTHAKDTGQRKEKGCGCMRSTDIGSYSLHPCGHNCLFCYANPMNPEIIRNHKQEER